MDFGWLWLCQNRFIDFDRYTTLVGDVCVEAGDKREFSVPFSQFCNAPQNYSKKYFLKINTKSLNVKKITNKNPIQIFSVVL